jgi:hypothetical protein
VHEVRLAAVKICVQVRHDGSLRKRRMLITQPPESVFGNEARDSSHSPLSRD